MIWVANVLLIVSAVLAGRLRIFEASLLSIAGNVIYLYVSVNKRLWDFAALSLVFLIVSCYNGYRNRP